MSLSIKRLPVLPRIAVLALMACSFPAGLPAQTPDNYATARDEVIAREKASFDAWKRKDKAFYDMTEFHPPSQKIATKAEVMPKLAEIMERWRLADIKMEDPRVQVYGNVALLTYVESVSGSWDGKPSRYQGKVTMVYVKQNGVWRGAHYHESLVAPAN